MFCFKSVVSGGCPRESVLVLALLCSFVMVPFQVAQSKDAGEMACSPSAAGPTLQWVTILASPAQDFGLDIAADGSGAVYVVGESYASWGSPSNPYSGDCDAFVAKLDRDGSVLWNTFLGSQARDVAQAVALDGAGSIYVVGRSQDSWGSPLVAYAGGEQDGFVAKLDRDGELQWHTFLGSADYDWLWDIVVDEKSSLYVLGESDGPWGNAEVGSVEADAAFVAKLDRQGTLLWVEPFGKAIGLSMASDNDGNLYVTGRSRVSWGSPIVDIAGDADAFVARLDENGALQWNTFLGSSSFDSGFDIAVDADGNAYVAGRSHATWGTPIRDFAGDEDAFIAKVDPLGELLWNSFVGSRFADGGWGVATCPGSGAWVVGHSHDWELPEGHYGCNDAFLALIDDTGTSLAHTFLGSRGEDYAYGVTSDPWGGVWTVGVTWSRSRSILGECDAFVARWSLSEESP